MTINVTNFSPAPGTKPALGAPLSFDVTFSPPESAAAHSISLAYGNEFTELAWDGGGFPVPYAASSRSVISGGYRYTVRRNGKWPAAPVLAVAELGGIEEAVAAAVEALISTANPQPPGTAAPGSSGEVSDADHVHPPPADVVPSVSGVGGSAGLITATAAELFADAATQVANASSTAEADELVKYDGDGRVAGYGLLVEGGDPATPDEDHVALYVDADGVLVAKDDSGRAIDVSARGMVNVASGTPTLVAGRVYEMTGTVTAATLPDCAASRGLPIGVINATAGAITVSRAGSDTIDVNDETTWTIESGEKAVFDAGPAARWYVW